MHGERSTYFSDFRTILCRNSFLPVHFVYFDGKIFVHGLPKGQKIENIAADPRVSFCVEKLNGKFFDVDSTP